MEEEAVNKLRFLEELELSVKVKSTIYTHSRKDPIPVMLVERKGYVIQRPISWIQLTATEDVLCLHEPLPKGVKIEGYLYEVVEGLAGCGIGPENAEKYLKLIGGRSLLERYKNTVAEIEKDVGGGDPRLSALASLIPVYRFSKYDLDLGKKALERWDNFKNELFGAYDPWLGNVYRSYLTPFPHPRYAPHLFLGTNPQVGKSYLGEAVGLRVDRATPASLVGGRLEGGVREGLLNGIDYLVQIEALELKSREDAEAINYLLNLLANGVAERLVYGTAVKTKFQGSLIFTFNVGIAPLDDLANVINVFSHNPMAVAERFLLLAHGNLMKPKNLEFNVEVVNEALMAARELTKNKVDEIYGSKVVRDWFNEYVDEWELVEGKISSHEWELEHVRRFMSNYGKEGWRKLKTLALARAVSEKLDLIYKGWINTNGLVTEAEVYLQEYLKMAAESIDVFRGEYEESLDRLLTDLAVSGKRKYERAVLEALHTLVTKKYGMMAYQDIEAEVSLDELIDLIKEMREVRAKNKSRETIKKILTKLTTSEVFRIFNYKVEEGRVVVNAFRLNEVYEKYIKVKEMK